MLGLSFKHWGLGIKLSVIASLSVAILFIAFTLSLTRSAGNQLKVLTLNDMQSQVNGVTDMINMYDTSLQAEVSNYTRLLASFLPTRFSLDLRRPRAADRRVVWSTDGAPVEVGQDEGDPSAVRSAGWIVEAACCEAQARTPWLASAGTVAAARNDGALPSLFRHAADT